MEDDVHNNGRKNYKSVSTTGVGWGETHRSQTAHTGLCAQAPVSRDLQVVSDLAQSTHSMKHFGNGSTGQSLSWALFSLEDAILKIGIFSLVIKFSPKVAKSQ